jgi:hypothetical protein
MLHKCDDEIGLHLTLHAHQQTYFQLDESLPSLGLTNTNVDKASSAAAQVTLDFAASRPGTNYTLDVLA